MTIHLFSFCFSNLSELRGAIDASRVCVTRRDSSISQREMKRPNTASYYINRRAAAVT